MADDGGKSEAYRRAQRKHDAARDRNRVAVRFTVDELARIDADRGEGESRQDVIRRKLGLTGWGREG